MQLFHWPAAGLSNALRLGALKAAALHADKEGTAVERETMFTPIYARASAAYKMVGAETSVQSATPHYLVYLLFTDLLENINQARGALARGQMGAKGEAIGRALAILEQGLRVGLNLKEGGDLARNLESLYQHCIKELTVANLRNDDARLQQVRNLIQPLHEAWQKIKPAVAQLAAQAPFAGA